MPKDYYILGNGRLKREGNTVLFIKSNGEKNFIPVEMIDKIHAFGEIDINTKALRFLNEHDIILNIYNYYGFYSGSFVPRRKKVSGYLTVHQVKSYLNFKERLYIARSFIEGSIFSMKRNIRKKLGKTEYLENIESDEEKLYDARSIEEIMAVEGSVRKAYYNTFKDITRGKFSMERRTKRPPLDPINAMISFGNSLTYTTVLGEIYKTALDPSISFLHEPSEKRFSLSLDIAEIFKPLITDNVIFKLINNKMITSKDFDIDENFTFLNNSGKTKFIKEFENRLKSTISHRKLKRKVSYRYLIRLECYKLIKHIIGDDIYKPLKPWW